MRSLVVCSNNFEEYSDRCISIESLTLNGNTINYALIESEDPDFDPERFPDSVLVKKTAFSCNYREIASMLNANAKISQIKNQIKYYPIGSEFVATVIAVGKNVKNLKVLDRVIPNGEYPFTSSINILPGLPTNHASRELEVLRAEKLFRIPDQIDDIVAAAFTIGAQTTYSMIEKLNIQEGKTVLITGINSNTSLFALNALKKRGVKIYGTSRDSRHHKKLYKLGLDGIFIISEQCDNILENSDVKNFLTLNGGFHYVIDPFADTHFTKVIDAMSMEGQYITCGVAEQFGIKTQNIKINLLLARIIQMNLSIYGNCLGTTNNLNKAVDDYVSGNLDVIIDSVFENNIKGFVEQTFKNKERFGKVVYKYS